MFKRRMASHQNRHVERKASTGTREEHKKQHEKNEDAVRGRMGAIGAQIKVGVQGKKAGREVKNAKTLDGLVKDMGTVVPDYVKSSQVYAKRLEMDKEAGEITEEEYAQEMGDLLEKTNNLQADMNNQGLQLAEFASMDGRIYDVHGQHVDLRTTVEQNRDMLAEQIDKQPGVFSRFASAAKNPFTGLIKKGKAQLGGQ